MRKHVGIRGDGLYKNRVFYTISSFPSSNQDRTRALHLDRDLNAVLPAGRSLTFNMFLISPVRHLIKIFCNSEMKQNHFFYIVRFIFYSVYLCVDRDVKKCGNMYTKKCGNMYTCFSEYEEKTLG